MVGYKESLCSPYEKLVLVSLSFKEKSYSVSNSLNSLVNNINFDNDTAEHSSINYEPDKNATNIYKSSIILDRQIETNCSKNVEADDEEGYKK